MTALAGLGVPLSQGPPAYSPCRDVWDGRRLPMLGVLGLAPDEESVYRALLGRPGATATQLGEVMSRPGSDVSAALSRLVESGLVVRAGPDGFTAAPPA